MIPDCKLIVLDGKIHYEDDETKHLNFEISKLGYAQMWLGQRVKNDSERELAIREMEKFVRIKKEYIRKCIKKIREEFLTLEIFE